MTKFGVNGFTEACAKRSPGPRHASIGELWMMPTDQALRSGHGRVRVRPADVKREQPRSPSWMTPVDLPRP